MVSMAKEPKRIRISKSKPKTKWAAVLRALRERLRLTQEDAAERFGIPPSTWVAWENGTRKPLVFTQKYLQESVFPKF